MHLELLLGYPGLNEPATLRLAVSSTHLSREHKESRDKESSCGWNFFATHHTSHYVATQHDVFLVFCEYDTNFWPIQAPVHSNQHIVGWRAAASWAGSLWHNAILNYSFPCVEGVRVRAQALAHTQRRVYTWVVWFGVCMPTRMCCCRVCFPSSTKMRHLDIHLPGTEPRLQREPVSS